MVGNAAIEIQYHRRLHRIVDYPGSESVYKKGAAFDAVFFFTSIGVGIIYAVLCNFTYTILWLLDNLSFDNDLVDFHSPKRSIILYVFVFLSCLVPFGILHLVKDLL